MCLLALGLMPLENGGKMRYSGLSERYVILARLVRRVVVFAGPGEVSVKRFIVSVLAGILLASCGTSELAPLHGSVGTSWTPVMMHSATASGFRTIFTFPSHAECCPVGGIVALNGSLYGIAKGGNIACNCGYVYATTPGGATRVVHLFTGGANGDTPEGRLAVLGGTLYGVTLHGGSMTSCHLGCGTVFSVTPSGAFHIVYDLPGGQGWQVSADLSAINGTLWGATQYAVFSVTPSGTYHSYSTLPARGPIPDMVEYGGKIWGAASSGKYGNGSIFTIDTSGHVSIVYNFTGGADGEFPNAGLVLLNGVLYGSNGSGGLTMTGSACSCGTIYAVSPAGNVSTLYTFDGPEDGTSPMGLIAAGGKLFGATVTSPNQGGGTIGGTVFSITPGGQEAVLRKFSGGSDGGNVVRYLGLLNGFVYGAAYFGGPGSCSGGCGTIFSVPTGK